MGRYEVLLQKPIEGILKSPTDGGQGVIVSKMENPTDFLTRLFRGNLLTKAEINDNLVDYYSQYSSRDGLSFDVRVGEEGEELEISPANDYTVEVMQKVRKIFKEKNL